MATITARIEIDQQPVEDTREAQHALWAVGLHADQIEQTANPGVYRLTCEDAEEGDLESGESFTATLFRDAFDSEVHISVYVTYAPPTPERTYS